MELVKVKTLMSLKRIDINLFKFNGFWTDIGNEEDYFNLNKLLKSKKISFLF